VNPLELVIFYFCSGSTGKILKQSTRLSKSPSNLSTWRWDRSCMMTTRELQISWTTK